MSKKLVFSVYVFIFSLGVHAQSLTINSTGQTGTSGTNWSISANTITVTGTATINTSVITTALTSGNLTILGNTSNFNVTISNIISTTSTHELTIGGPSNTGTITINQAVNIGGLLTFIGGVITGSGNIGLAANRTVTFNVGSPSTYSGIISGATSGLIKAGNGQLTLTNDHTYTGSTVINGGVLRVGSLSSLFVSGTISSTSAVAIASGCKLILSPNENINFAAPISGAGDLEIIGESGEYYSVFLTGTATTMVTNSTVLEVLSRISSGLQQGGAITSSFVQVAGAYHKNYNAASNTATFQLQQYDGQFTKCVFVILSQSGSNVQIRGNTGIYNTGAAYRSGNTLGVDLSTGSTSMGFATSSGASGYGIAKIYMSGKVNLTGALTLTGNIMLSNTAVNITSNPNTHAYTSKGTLEITNSSSSLSTCSSIINNGVLIYNSSTALSISTNMSGTGEVIQVGTATTSLTGSNTNSGSTIIASNTTLQIGAGSTTGTYTNNVFNFGTLQFNRSDNSTYAGVISGTGSLTKSGDGNLTLTGLNTFTGTTTISAGKLILERNVPSFSSSSISGNGELVIQPAAISFTNAISYPISGINVVNSIGGLTIGKPLNAANITLSSATSIAGPIAIYGGNVFAQQNLTSTLSGAAILLQATGYIDVSASRTIQTNNGNITLRSNSGGTAVVLPNSTTGAITLNSGSSLLSTGGNITLGGNFAGTQGAGLYAASARVNGAPGVLISNATLNAAGGNINIYGRCSTSYDDGIRLQANMSTTGAGTIGLYGDAFGGLLSGTPNTWFGGITFITNSSTVETENGNINIEGVLTDTQSNGTYALNFFRTTYTTGAQDRHIQIISKTGDIQITADRGTTSAGGMGHSSWGHIYFGSPLSGSWTATGDVKLAYSSFVGAGFFGYKVKTTGAVIYEPTAASFVNAQTFPHNANYTVAESASSLTIGKPGNTANITCNATQTVAGPIAIYGGTISINENLNTSAGAALGNVLLKGSGDVTLAANKSITTSGAPVILWANSDNETTNGSVALRNGSYIVTGSSSVSGGHIWIGGGSDGTTWYGLAVGNGYAVPGTSFTPTNGGSALQAGIYLERNSISSFGGNIKIAGDGAATARGIVTYGNTVAIDAGSGGIDIDGQITSTAAGNRGGILFGLHDNTVTSTVNISSSATSGDAITINGVGRGTDDAIALSGTLNITSSGGGNIVMNGNALGSGRSIVVGNYYHGIMNIFANSGNISLNGNTKAVQVAAAIVNGLTAGPSKLNIGQGGAITSSSSDVFITADNIALAAHGIAITTSGEVTVEPASASFANAVTFPITNLSIANTITGLTIGKPSNTANVTIASPTTIAGPISIYGGTVALNENIESSNGSTITLFANTLNFASGKTVTSNNGQLIVAPQDLASTVGLAGATGTLQLPESYFSTNFTDGFSEIQIGTNNHSGAIATNAFTLRDHMSFLTSGSLTLGFKPVLGSNNVTLGSAISSIVGTPTNYFQTNGTGKVIRTIPTGSNLLFPIGKLAYNPLSVENNTGTEDVFSARVLDSVFLNGTTGPIITTPHVRVTWDISKANGNADPGVDFEFGWNADQEVGTISSYKLNHYDDDIDNNWSFAIGTSDTPSGTTTKTMSHTGYTGTFSPFAISQGGSPLPVELLSFTAQCEDNSVKLRWQTASELNASHFEVERSVNANDWEQIGVEAAAGNSTVVRSYTFEDNSTVARSLMYYRLVQVDFDGNAEVLGPVYSNCTSDEGWELAVAPNPTNGNFGLYISSETEQTVNIQILGSDGKIIADQWVQIPVGTSIQSMRLNDAAPGMYSVFVQHKAGTSYQKLVVNWNE